MKLKKMPTITMGIMILIIITNLSWAADWSRYIESSLDDIIKETDECSKKHGRQGVAIKLDALRVSIRIQEYPTKISEGSINIVKTFFDATKMEEKYRSLYNYEMNYNYKGNKFCFIFQGVLVDSFKREITQNGCVKLLIINGIYNTFDNVHTILVNEFNGEHCADDNKIIKNSNYYFNLGVEHITSKNYDKAEECFTLAIEKDNTNCAAYANRGSLLYYFKNKYTEALHDLNKAVQLNCANSVVYNYRAYSFYKLNQMDNAKNDWETIIKLDPKNYDAYYNLSCYYSTKNDIKKGLEYLNKAIELGFSNKESLMKDPDLINIRNSKQFQTIFNRMK